MHGATMRFRISCIPCAYKIRLKCIIKNCRSMLDSLRKLSGMLNSDVPCVCWECVSGAETLVES